MSETLQSVQNTLQILDLFASNGPYLTLKDIGEHTGLHKSTVYRCVSILEKSGYLEKDLASHRYRLGLHVVHLASSRIDALELQVEAKPLLLRLQAKTNCAVHLCILDRTDVVYLLTIDNYSVLKSSMQVSKRNPAYCSSTGKCLLSSLSGDDLSRLYRNYQFIKYTDNTITDLNTLKTQLAEIRNQSFAINLGEMEEQTASIAVPVLNYAGETIAAIGVGMHRDRFSESMASITIPYLKNTADELSKNLGYIK